jgi:hypothetical protein
LVFTLAITAGAVVVAASFGDVARAAHTSFVRSGTILVDGRPFFPIVLSPGPAVGSRTPWGTDALAELAAAGVNVFRIGPGTQWRSSDIASALAYDKAAAAVNAYTWVNLSGYSQALPGSPEDAGLADVVSTLTSDPSGRAIAMWRGRDEPWWNDIAPSALQFAYCRITSRGDPTWCGGENPLAPGPLWVTIEAPRGTAADLAPYSDVTDVHGVDVYPVVLNQPSPDLHRVGRWTARLASVSPGEPVSTTLQICSSGSNDPDTGVFVLPTPQQERYMAYDAIANGANQLIFFGGDIPGCWSQRDREYGWNWSFWETVLKPLVQELSASSPIAPALVNAGSSMPVTTNDSSTEAVLRQGTSVDDIWLIAARSGTGTETVRFSGLPSWVHAGAVYKEKRRVLARRGSFRDGFDQWDVHVYHFVEPLLLRRVTPAGATVGSRITLRGRGLAAATKVSFGRVRARFTIRSDQKLVIKVPRRARSGPITVTTPLAGKETGSSFAVLPSPKTLPTITGRAGAGSRLKASTGTWYGDPPTSYRYRWLLCDEHGRDCSTISGATRRSVRLTSLMVGGRVRVRVTAYTPSGSARARSAPTAIVSP